MGTAQVTFEVVLVRWRYRSDVTESDVSGSDVSQVAGSYHVRSYILRMRNRKLHHIRHSRVF